jgi:hypothetical protein
MHGSYGVENCILNLLVMEFVYESCCLIVTGFIEVEKRARYIVVVAIFVSFSFSYTSLFHPSCISFGHSS